MENGHARDATTIGKQSDMFLTEHLAGVFTDLCREHDKIQSTRLTENADFDQLKTALRKVCTLGQETQVPLVELSGHLCRVRETLTGISKTIETKLKDEGLKSWMNRTSLYNEDATDHAAQEKTLLAKAAAARAAAAAANADVIRAVEQVALLEAEAATLAYDAEVAMREAEAALAIAQQTQAVADAKRKADAEIVLMEKQEAEERRKKEEEEERRRRRMEEERARQQPEEDAEEVAAMDPRNWPRYVYEVAPGDMLLPLCCLVRALPDMLTGGQGAFNVTSVPQLGIVELRHNAELVSHVFRLDGAARNAKEKITAPLLVTIPHCAPRIASRETVVRMRDAEGTWTDLPTRDTTVEDMKDLKFVEARLDTVDVTLCVITRVKQEQFLVTRRGGAICPSVDSRVCIDYERGTYILNTPISLKIQPVDSAAMADLKRRKLPHCEDLVACSPIISYLSTSPNTSEKLIRVNVGLSSIIHERQGRPRTAIIKRQGATGCPKPRPATAFGSAYSKRDKPKEVTQLLCKLPKGRWTVSDIRVVPTQKQDVVTFHVQNPTNRFMVMRSVDNPAGSHPVRIAQHLETSVVERACQFILLQNEDNNNDVIVQCVSSVKTSHTLQELAEDGYTLGPGPSAIVYLREGQAITLTFRGNIGHLDGSDTEQTFVFNSNLRSRLAVQVTELNIYAQKSVDCYRGFAQIYTQPLPARPRSSDNAVERVPDDPLLLCELLIQLPKPDPETLQPIILKAPVKIRANGVVNNELLRHLAAELGDEWRQLAENLELRRGRLAAIMRNNVNDRDEAVYEMLVTWAKQVPLATSTVNLLCGALETVDRTDLAQFVREREARRPFTANGAKRR